MSALYLEHFGLRETPFSITPNPQFFWAGSGRGSLLQALRYAVQSEEGIVTVIGEVGSGKTMLCRMLLENLPEGIDAVYLANPSFSRNEILDAIAHDLGVDTSTAPSRVDALNAELIRRFAAGRRVVLLIDEAHAMPRDSLEEVRLLSNLETSTRKLLNIVLFGQPELNELLAQRDLRQLRERVVQRFELGPLPPGELRDYLAFRLQTAGYRGALPFSDAALALIARAACGITRRVHILADKALLSAFARNVQRAEVEDVRRAIRDAGLQPAAQRPRWQIPALAAGLVLAFLGGHYSRALLDSGAATPAAEGEAVPVTTPSTAAPPRKEPSPPDRPSAAEGADRSFDPATNPAPPHPDSASPAPALPPQPVAEPPPAPARKADPLDAALQRFDRWLDQSGTAYTLQVATLYGQPPEQLRDRLRELGASLDDAPLMAARLPSGSATGLVVYVGDHPDAVRARQALDQLPPSIRHNQPIVRSRATLRRGD